jgi:hypothetical protein
MRSTIIDIGAEKGNGISGIHRKGIIMQCGLSLFEIFKKPSRRNGTVLLIVPFKINSLCSVSGAEPFTISLLLVTLGAFVIGSGSYFLAFVICLLLFDRWYLSFVICYLQF